MKRRRRMQAPRPTAPDSLPGELAAEPDRAQIVNDVLSARGLQRPEIDAWWGLRLDDNDGRSRTEMWVAGEYDAVERQARGGEAPPGTPASA